MPEFLFFRSQTMAAELIPDYAPGTIVEAAYRDEKHKAVKIGFAEIVRIPTNPDSKSGVEVKWFYTVDQLEAEIKRWGVNPQISELSNLGPGDLIATHDAPVVIAYGNILRVAEETTRPTLIVTFPEKDGGELTIKPIDKHSYFLRPEAVSPDAAAYHDFLLLYPTHACLAASFAARVRTYVVAILNEVSTYSNTEAVAEVYLKTVVATKANALILPLPVVSGPACFFCGRKRPTSHTFVTGVAGQPVDEYCAAVVMRLTELQKRFESDKAAAASDALAKSKTNRYWGICKFMNIRSKLSPLGVLASAASAAAPASK